MPDAIPFPLSPRLLLRPWRDADRAPFAALNADPEVMAHFPKPLTHAESDAGIEISKQRLHEQGFGFMPAERKDTGDFIGMVGVQRIPFQMDAPADFNGGLEIGWRLAREHWGHGFASEAAKAWLDWVWANTDESRVWSFTATSNTKSAAVMERIGMRFVERFAHPRLPEDHRLSQHVLYRIDRS